jgi:N-acetylneuraminate synthase
MQPFVIVLSDKDNVAVAVRDIPAGALITEADLDCRRPAAGRTAFEFYEVVGATAARDYRAGDYLD